jgi:hypothetical protein
LGAVTLGVTVLVAVALAPRLSYYLLDPYLSTDEASLALDRMHPSNVGCCPSWRASRFNA